MRLSDHGELSGRTSATPVAAPVDNRTLAGARSARVRLTSLCDENFTRAVRRAASVRYASPSPSPSPSPLPSPLPEVGDAPRPPPLLAHETGLGVTPRASGGPPH